MLDQILHLAGLKEMVVFCHSTLSKTAGVVGRKIDLSCLAARCVLL